MAGKKKAVEAQEESKATGNEDVSVALNARIAKLESAVVFCRDTIDPGGIIAPQPGTPGYMIDVIKALHGVCPVKK